MGLLVAVALVVAVVRLLLRLLLVLLLSLRSPAGRQLRLALPVQLREPRQVRLLSGLLLAQQLQLAKLFQDVHVLENIEQMRHMII